MAAQRGAALRTFTYGGAGNIATEVPPGAETIAYTKRNRLASVTRNGFGEVIQEVSPDAGTTVLVRDAHGLVTQKTDGRGVVENRTYDNAGRQLTSSYPAATSENITTTYDSIVSANKGKGRLTKMQDQSGTTEFVYDALGRVITDKRTIAGKIYTTAYGYTTSGRLASMTYPSGRTLAITRNANGQVTRVSSKQNATATAATVATSITYAPLSDLVKTITHGNGLVTSAGYDLDYRLASLAVKDGAVNVQAFAYAYGDNLNLTGITDQVTAANSNTLTYSPANRLAGASGAWGTNSFTHDSVGNRLSDTTTLAARLSTYATASNRMTGMSSNGGLFRTYTYDGAGNIITDVRPGESFAYTYNKRNRLSSVTRNSAAYATYIYNALEQLASRNTSAVGGPVGTVHYIYDRDGHLIAEADAATGATTREYIWLPANDNANDTIVEAMGLVADNDNVPDLPLAVIANVNTAPVTYAVHTDHLGRPVRMTDASRATVWQAVWKPWGEVHATSGTQANNLRFPGQYFQIETGLAYNWHRHYDPVTGRYTQPDPLRFVDGPNVYAYAGSSPVINTDRLGLMTGTNGLPHSQIPPNSGGVLQCGSGDDDWKWCHKHCWERARAYGIDVQPLYARCMNNCLGFRPG